MSKRLLKILIIDDSLEDRTTFRHFLQKDDEITYSFFEAEMGEEGLELCAEQQPDCILLDYQLPDTDGITLLAKLNPNPLKPTLPVVMMTGAGDEALAVKALKSGAQDYLAKGKITPEQLRHTVRRAIEKVAVMRELASQHQLLAESEARFFAAFHNSSACMSIVSEAEVKYIDVNESSCKLFGVTREEAIGHSPTEFNFYADPTQRIALRELLNRDGYVHDFEVRWRTKSGEILTHLLNADQITINGKPCLFVVSNDITQRKEAEVQLRLRDERFRLATDATHALVYDVNYQQGDSIIVYGFNSLFGVTPPEHLTRAWYRDQVHPDDLPQLQKTLVQAVDGSDYTIQYRVRHSAGHYLYVEDRGRLVLNDEKQVVRGIGTLLDITTKKEAEQKLRASQERLKLGIEVAEFAICEIDYTNNTNHLSKEAAKLYGLGEEEITVPRETVHATFHPDDAKELAPIIAESLNPDGEGWFAREHRIVWKNGEVRWLSVRKQIFFDRTTNPARPIRSILAAHDITERKTSELALRISEERLRLAIEAADMTTWQLSADGTRTLGANYADVVGAAPTIPEEFLEIIHPDDRERFQTALAQTRDEKAPFKLEYRVIPPDGNLRWLASQGRILTNSNGQPEMILGIVANITERKHSEEKLRVSEERLNLAMTGAKIGSFDWNIKTGAIEWSSQTEESAAMSAEAFDNSFEGFRKLIHPLDREKVEGCIESALKDGDYECEFRMIKGDGGIRWVIGKGHVTFDDEGSPARLVGVDIDITKRKLAEETLRENQEFTQSIIATAPTVLYTFDLKTQRPTYLTDQAATVLGYSFDEIKDNQSIFLPNFMHPDDAKRAEKYFQAINEALNGEVFEFEYRMQNKAGEWRWFRSRDRVFRRDDDGKAQEILGIALDITERKRQEEQLQLALNRNEVAQEAAGAMLYEYLPQTDEVIRNDSFASIVGYAADEIPLTGTMWKSLIHPDDVKQTWETISAGIESGAGFSVEYRVRHKDGHYIWLYDRARVLRDESGTVERIIGMFLDISERKQAEQQLAEQRRLYKSITDNATTALFIMDERQQCVFMNPAAEELIGYTFAETYGRALHDVVHHTHPDGSPYPLSECPIDQAFPTRNQMQGEEIFVHKNGHFYDVAFTASPLSDETGTTIGTVIEVQDITTRKQAERERAYLAAQVESSQDAMFGLTLDRLITSWNAGAEKLFGWTAQEIIGQSLFTLIPEDKQDEARQVITRFDSGAVVPPFETVRIRKDGSRVDVSVALSPILNENGTVVGVTVTARDITERKAADEKLRASEEFNRTVLESSPDCVKILDGDGRLEYMNANGLCLLEIDDFAPFKNEFWWNLWQEETKPVIKESLAKALRGETAEFEAFCPTIKGTPKWWNVIVSPVTGADGKISRLISVSRDITDRKQAELNLAFRTDLQADFAPLLTADDILRVAGERIAAFLNLTNCSFVEINEAMDTAHVVHDQHTADAIDLAGVYPMKDFHSAEERAEMLAGRAIVINDTGAMREPETAARFDALGIRALLTAPYVSNGRWRFCLCAMRDQSCIWSKAEVELLTEIAARIYIRFERGRAEEKLRISEERFRRLFESAKDGILILNPDTAQIIDANPYIAGLLGYSPAELIGKELWEIGLFKDIEKSQDAMRELQAKKYIRYEDLLLETKTGRRINVEFVSNVYVEGNETVIQCNIRDITERKIAEQRLRDEEERFRLLTENAKDYAIVFIDKEMRITHWNKGAERILGWTEKEIIGQPVALIFTPEDQTNKIPEKEIAIAKEKGQARDERWHLRKDNSRFYGFGEMIALRDETGNLRGFAKLFRDLTENKLAENRLRESEEKFRAIFDSIDEGFCIVEMIFDENDKPVDYIVSQANPAFSMLTGLPPEALGKSISELVPDLEKFWFETYGRVALTGKPERFENFAEPMNRWFSVYASRVGGAESRRVAIVFNNITERRLSEETLRKSEAEFRTLANAVPQIVWVTGADGVMEFVNEQWTEFSGLDLAATDTPETVDQVIHPDDRILMYEAWGKAFANGLAFEFEARMRNQKTNEYHWFLVKSEPSRDSQGNIQKWFGTSTDITVNKDAALKLRESEERLELAVSATQLGIWDADLITGESYWSRRNYKIHGISSEVVITPEFINNQIIHPEDLPGWQTAIRDAINPKGNGLLNFEHRTIWPDGTERWVAVQGRTHFAEVGGYLRAIRLAGSTLDITQRKQFEAARESLLTEEQHLREIAESHNRAKDEFLAVVSHELRNPLNAILGYTHILRLNPHDAVKVANHTEIIERSARMQQKLIEDLLDTARIISGKLKIETIPIDLHLVIEDALTVVRPAAQAKRIKLISQVENKVQNIIGDGSRLQQIIWNLLQNAIKFTPEGGRVELITELSEESVHIIIKDSGQGIKPEFLSSVFDRFSQDDMARTRRHGGLGLGLALVKQLVELHGGKIEAESAGVGLGATFIVTLPLHVTQLAEQLTPVPAISAFYNDSEVIPLKDLPRLDGVHVLVLDDQEEARLMVATTLQEQGATVQVAATGESVRKLLETEVFDIFVCDIAMPDEDGYEVIRKIRALENLRGVARSQRIPAVALTALARSEDRLQALNAGFQMHVAKPVELAELIMVIVSLTQNRQKNKVQ